MKKFNCDICGSIFESQKKNQLATCPPCNNIFQRYQQTVEQDQIEFSNLINTGEIDEESNTNSELVTY
jgi:predicted  nucleic acid-binding Zn-ribbon protein